MNGLDLFSGIGGLTVALQDWVKPVAYCEIEQYARAVLLSRMSEGELPVAPIWDDVQTLKKEHVPVTIDIIYGGFPCQDISAAGRREGIQEGNRSGLFFEIMRLADEFKPRYLFLENVPNIRTKGLDVVLKELTERGYDCVWTVLSAAEVGALHVRKRWWLLAYPNGKKPRGLSIRAQETHAGAGINGKDVTYPRSESTRADKDVFTTRQEPVRQDAAKLCGGVFNSNSARLQEEGAKQSAKGAKLSITSDWWTTEPDVGRVVNGLPYRVDRIKALGNSVVPAQAHEAFKYLWGLMV